MSRALVNGRNPKEAEVLSCGLAEWLLYAWLVLCDGAKYILYESGCPSELSEGVFGRRKDQPK